jgi:hypothetical protein
MNYAPRRRNGQHSRDVNRFAFLLPRSRRQVDALCVENNHSHNPETRGLAQRNAPRSGVVDLEACNF